MKAKTKKIPIILIQDSAGLRESQKKEIVALKKGKRSNVNIALFKDYFSSSIQDQILLNTYGFLKSSVKGLLDAGETVVLITSLIFYGPRNSGRPNDFLREFSEYKNFIWVLRSMASNSFEKISDNHYEIRKSEW